MAKTLDYQITLYPAHRDGAFVVTPVSYTHLTLPTKA